MVIAEIAIAASSLTSIDAIGEAVAQSREHAADDPQQRHCS